MNERVHFIPVGFDFDRLILPISKGEMDADRVVIVTHEADGDGDDPTDRAIKLASNMAARLEEGFELVGVEVQTEPLEIDNLYDYETLYSKAYDYILDELEEGNEVFVNISSMPRTAAFAFATAADSIITGWEDDKQEIRNRLHTYYVPPDQYLVHEMIDALEEAKELFEQVDEDIRFPEHYNRIGNLLDKIDKKGVTEGAEDPIEFPASPAGDVGGFETEILRFLHGKEPFTSTSELAKQLADHLGEEYDEGFRSKVQYNVTRLEEKGYIEREKLGKGLKTQLSTMGRMWAGTH